jgi:hypothetical protein
MDLNELLKGKSIDPKGVLVFRHRPWEPALKKVLPSLAEDKPDVFNAYQQTQTEKVEKAMTRAAFVAAFIGHEPGKALFVGLYANEGQPKRITRNQFWQIPGNVVLKNFGMKGFTEESPRSSCLLFNLVLKTDFYGQWKGKLIVEWPGLERSYWRWADRNEIPVLAILDESALNAAMPKWNELDLTWEQLRMIPASWRSKLEEWRGIYYIFDTSDRKGYVGAAYGDANLKQRWLGCAARGNGGYAAHGHGGNRLLRKRNPEHFRFTILELVARNMDRDDVIRLEANWKDRLHTRRPLGLNDN